MTGLPGAFDRAQLSNCSLIALQRECLESAYLASTVSWQLPWHPLELIQSLT